MSAELDVDAYLRQHLLNGFISRGGCGVSGVVQLPLRVPADLLQQLLGLSLVVGVGVQALVALADAEDAADPVAVPQVDHVGMPAGRDVGPARHVDGIGERLAELGRAHRLVLGVILVRLVCGIVDPPCADGAQGGHRLARIFMTDRTRQRGSRR